MGSHARRLRWLAATITGLALLFGCTPAPVITPTEQGPTRQPRTIRVLAIGNSYSAAAVDWDLSPIARQASDHATIGSAFIGGASINQHVNNLASDEPLYRYANVGPTGQKTTENQVTLKTILHREKWDVITLQQASQFSGDFTTFSKLGALAQSVLAEVPTARIMLHETWYYAAGAQIPGFARYDNDQATMDARIADAYAQARELVPGSGIIPVGPVIRRARAAFPESSITHEDGTHLAVPVGQYLAAATWYAVLFDNTVVGNAYRPQGMSDEDLLSAQKVVDEIVSSQPSPSPGR